MKENTRLDEAISYLRGRMLAYDDERLLFCLSFFTKPETFGFVNPQNHYRFFAEVYEGVIHKRIVLLITSRSYQEGLFTNLENRYFGDVLDDFVAVRQMLAHSPFECNEDI